MQHFVGIAQMSDGRSYQYCSYGIFGGDFSGSKQLTSIANEVAQIYGPDFLNNIRYDLPENAPFGLSSFNAFPRSFNRLTEREQDNFERMVLRNWQRIIRNNPRFVPYSKH